jgi:hypothetical protein
MGETYDNQVYVDLLGDEGKAVSSDCDSRSLLRLYLRLAITIWSVLALLLVEEFVDGEEIAWYCAQCGRSMDGEYVDDIDKHPYCEGTEMGKLHERMKMTAVARA